MSNLSPIIGSTETIAAAAAGSLNAAFIELHDAFGFWPRVLSPYGGARTQAECDHEGTSWRISDHYEDAGDRAAVDIDNQHQFRAINEALFLSILAKHGWHNMNTAGTPFPNEPWHFAKHGLTTAGENIHPLGDDTAADDTEEEEPMEKPILLEHKNKDNSRQWALVYVAEKRWIDIYTVDAANALSTAFKTLTPVVLAEWNSFRAAVDLPADVRVS